MTLILGRKDFQQPAAPQRRGVTSVRGGRTGGLLDALRRFFQRSKGTRRRRQTIVGAGKLKQTVDVQLPYRVRPGSIKVRVPGVRIRPETVIIQPQLEGGESTPIIR